MIVFFIVICKKDSYLNGFTINTYYPCFTAQAKFNFPKALVR
jgi:hypothetical protein